MNFFKVFFFSFLIYISYLHVYYCVISLRKNWKLLKIVFYSHLKHTNTRISVMKFYKSYKDR